MSRGAITAMLVVLIIALGHRYKINKEKNKSNNEQN
jgi:hypothetical protein